MLKNRKRLVASRCSLWSARFAKYRFLNLHILHFRRCFSPCLGYRTEESDCCDTGYVHFNTWLFISFRFVSQNTVSQFYALLWYCCLSEGVYHDLFWFFWKRLHVFALQRSYNSWEGFKIATWQIWLHNSLGSPPQVNKLQKISASIEAAGKCF